MAFTNFPNGVTSFGIPCIGAMPPSTGNHILVGPNTSISTSDFATVTEALSVAKAGDTIMLQPGIYNETVTVSLDNITLVGLGNVLNTTVGYEYGGTASDQAALVVTGKNCTVMNIDFSGGATAAEGVAITGDGFKAYNCKFEMQNDAGVALKFAPTAVAGYTGSIATIEACEFAWAETGIQTSTDTSSTTQCKILNCQFNNLSVECIGEANADSVRNFVVQGCTFDTMEDGTAPSGGYIVMSGNTSTGVVTQCAFPTATNSGENAVGTKIIWVSNFHTDGISTGQPS